MNLFEDTVDEIDKEHGKKLLKIVQVSWCEKKSCYDIKNTKTIKIWSKLLSLTDIFSQLWTAFCKRLKAIELQ